MSDFELNFMPKFRDLCSDVKTIIKILEQYYEPKEKEKCFCEFEMSIKQLKELLDGKWAFSPPYLCPICGKKLNE